jgi:hypothetical protein
MAAIAAQRGQRSRIVVPEVVAGEAFTKLRYDRRVSGRHDARAALTVFGLLAADSELFELRGMPDESYRRSGELLATYVDQGFSWVDAIVLLCADDDRQVDGLWTVDASLAVYHFSHQISLSSPA